MLQQIQAEDQAFIFEGLSHPDVIPFYGVRYDSYESTSKQMEWYGQILNDGSGIPWKIIEKESGKKIGVIGTYLFKPEHRKAEAGYWILPQFWNKGYATESLNAVINYWKNEKQIHRLEAFVEEGNKASSRILEKCGFHYEGKMKDCEMKNGKFISLEIYAWLNKG